MTQEEATDVFNKLPEALQVLSDNVFQASLYIVHVNKYLLEKGLYVEFCEYFDKIINIKKETLQ
jgi:hypothetical protein